MEDGVLSFIRARCVSRGKLPVVSLSVCREAAEECGATLREVEIAALHAGICPSRYERTIGSLGAEGQARLLESCAAVVGCGGLGGWMIEILARAGVGRLILIDGDTFAENNLNRQLYATEENIGAPKARAAAARVKAINSSVEAEAREAFIDEANGEELLRGADVVLDALDGNRSRSVVFGVCEKMNVPFVHGAVAGFFGEAAVLRAGCVPPWERVGAGDRGIEAEIGTMPFTPPFVASLQVAEAVKILAGVGGGADHTLLWFDLLRRDMQKLKLRRV